MKIELIENTEFGFYNIKFGSRPDYEHNADMLNELKANGWAWSRHNGVWYPRTTDAKAKANTFAAEFAKKYNEPEKSFGQELFERTQRIDQWKKEHLPQEQYNEPVKEESKPVELNDNQKKVYDLLKATNNFSENQILEMVSKIDTAYQTESFEIPELSWEEIKSFIHADDSFDLAKDLRDVYNPNISESYNKINVVYNYIHDLMDFDVLGENQYERSADAEYHTMRESLRHDILQPVCENIVMGRYSDFFDMQEDFISRREEKIADISKSYMENPAIKEQYIGMKRAELIEKAPEMLKGREFNSWIFNVDNDGHFLFYESNGYLKSEFLNDDKYNAVKDFLAQVEELDLLEESSKQLKEEYTKMHSLLEKPPVQIQEELIAREVEENADEEIDTSISEYNDLGIDTRTGEPWNGEESEDVFEPEIQEKGSTELTQADLDNATKVIPEEQYQFMLENAAGEEAEYFKKKLKNMATICTDLQKHSNKENVNKDGSHPCKLHYFLGNCDWYISELDNDGIGFGYCILNGDLYNSEWGSVNVCGDSTYEQPLTKMAINVPIRINGSEFHRSVSPELDLHLDEDTTIERELYKLDNEYFADYKKYAEKNEKILAKSSEVSINIIEETNKELEVENGSKTDIGYERRTGISSGSNPNQGLEERGAYSDRGSDTGRGQRILHSEREENGSLENSEGIPELHTVGRESEISDLHIEEIQSGNNEILHSERSLETGNSDLQQTGLENGQIPHRVRTIEPEHGTGVNPNENTSSEPLHGNEEVIKITLVERSALNLLAVNSDCYWYIEKNKNPENYNVMPKQDLIDLGSYAYPYENYVSKDNAKIINDLLEKYDIHYQKLSIHVNQNLEQNIEQEADKQFKEITNQYDTQYKDFYDTYNKMKESYTENESRYVSDARIGDMFRQVHRELVNLQMNELTDLIKQAPNADIARINATRYFNFCGQDEFSYLHDNLYLRCNLGDYTKDNGRRFVAPTGEELQNFIEETYNSLHGIVAEKETPVYNINGTEYTQETIETLITEDIQNVLNTLSHVPVIEGVRLYQNPEQTGAINILLQYSTKNNDVKWSEDSLFNVLAQEEFTFNGMPVDVNPITPEKSGTIEQYLKRFESLGVTNENEAIAKQAEMLDEQFDFAKLADDICQQSYEQSGAGFNYYIYFDEIAGLAGKDVAWVKENIEKIGEALEEHNDELLLDFNLKEALEEDSLDLNFCSVGEDVNELFKKDDTGRWVRKTDRELAYERAIDEHSSKWDELESSFSGLETFRGNFEEIKREVFEQHLDNNERFNETQWQEETVYRLLEENINFGALAETAEELEAPNHSQLMEQRSVVLEDISSKIVSGEINAADYQRYYEEKYPESFNSEIKVKTYDFFINDVANLDLGIGAEIEPITGLSADNAATTYANLKLLGYNPYIGLNIPGDFVFDDKEGQGAGIFTETNGRPSFYMGDNFVKDLKKNDEHAKTVITAYKELYLMTDKYIKNVERPYFVFEKEKELFGNKETHTLTNGTQSFEMSFSNKNVEALKERYEEVTKENEIEAEYKIMQEISKGLTPDEIKLNLDKYRESLDYAQEKSMESWEDYYARNTTGFDTPQTVAEFRQAYEHNKKQFEYDVNKYTGWIKALEEVQTQNIDHKEEASIQLNSKKDIKAIREQCREILQKPDSEITEADKIILSQYEGAGGIKEDNRTVSGILNEFYTPNNLVEKVWQIVDAYAPNAKTVLEPSAGVGKFANNRPNNEFTMHELDETSARINKILHPEANVIQGAYQKQFFDAGERIHTPGQKSKYDVVIGNPPYGTYNDKYKGLGEGKEFDRYEEYFISKGLDALKDDDSRLAFVVPSGFLNSSKDKQKEIIASKGHLIDAYRLPEKTFPTTEVGTDIIILKKWKLPKGQMYPDNSMLQAAAGAMSDGKYFDAYPEKILGEVKTRSNRFGKQEEYVTVHEGLTIQEELNKIDSMLPKIEQEVPELKTYHTLKEEDIKGLEIISDEEFSDVVGVGVAPTISALRFPEEQPATRLRPSPTTINESIAQESEKSSSPSIQNQPDISLEDKIYNKYIEANIQPAKKNEQTVSQDIAQSTEVVEEELDDPTKRLYEDPDGVFKTKHQLTREEFAKFYTGANFTQEDYNIWGATDWKGNVDTSKLTEAELAYLKTSDNYVETNEGVYTNAMLYATGNIYQKLDELEENKENLSSESYEKAKAILTNAIPKVVPIENIKIDALSPLAQEFKVHREVTSSRWYMGRTELQTVELDIDLREDFINWATNCSSLDNFDENNQSINSRRSIYNYSSAKISREDIPEDISWTDIVNYIDRVPVPTHIDEKNDTKEVKNKKYLIAGNIKDARKNTCYELFNRYIQDGLPQEDKERLQSTWNRIYNATVHADYKKLPLFIDGMSTFKNNQPFMLYKQQVEGVSRLLSKGNGLLAYEVGVGKTAAGIVTTMGQLQTGRCKRPLIIVPNQVYKKWVNDFRELFPDVKINELYNLSEKYIDKHFDERTHSLLIEPGSVTVITDSALQKITFSDAVCSKELAEDFSYLLGVSDALHSGDDKEKAKAYQKILNEIGKASRVQVKKLPEGREQRIQQSYIFFDECGFDNVVIDEAHRYKNLFTIPRPKRGDKGAREFEGLGTGKPSIRAEKVFGITTLIQRRNEDRNVFLLTATPFTNNPLEVYSMLSYMGRKELINRHIYDVRDFCTEFAQTKFEYSVKPTGDIEPKQVMKNFRGQKKLKNLVFEYIDVVSAKEAGIERPEGERHPIYLELSPLQQRIIKLEQDAIAAADNPYVTLKAMTTMRTCTLSPALLDPDDFAGVEDIVIPPKSQIVESSPKLSWVCNTVADLYKQKPECGQFIYMPQGKDCFDEVKNYLIKQGIPEDAIDYIHSTHNGSAEDKEKISARFNDVNDKLKILIGTATVAEGIDLNGNSIVEYNTMLGWNPTESIQVEGRIWRQGNLQGKVHIMYPLMENSIDALIYQKHDEKAHRINSVLSKSDDGNDVIDTDEINPETIKFELITDPEKKIKMIIDEKTAEKRKEIKVIDNRLETIQELEEDRQNSKTLYDTNVEEKEKYKSLLKTAREELKADPNNWQKEARVTSNERAVDTCNKEIAKARNRLNTISYNFNKFDIHEPEREVPIKLQELVTKKAELEADITDIENSKDRLIAEEQKKLLEKKILSKPVEELRKEWVEYVNKNTWYKKQNDKSKDRKETVQVPLEAVKDFKVPDEMIKKFDKAMAEMDFKVLHNYLNWGDRDIINDCHENDKAIVIFRERYEKTKGVKLPEQFRKTTEYLVSVCDEKTLPEVCKFKSMEEAVACACSSWHGEAYQRDGYVEYVTLDNFKRNRDVSALAKDLQKREGQSYHGLGSPNGFGYDCSPKGVKIEAFINKKREEFFVDWNQVAKIKAKQWNREYPAEFTIKDEPKREGEEKLKNIQMVQQDLFDFDEVKVQTKTLDIRMQGYNSQFILSDQALVNYRGLPPFMKKSNDEWVIRCKGEDFTKPQEGIASYELVDISLTKEQLQGMVNSYLFAQQQEINHKKFENPGYKEKVICPKPEVSDMQKDLLQSNGISENDLKKATKENFNELLCEGEKPILKKKLPQQKVLKQEANQKLLPNTTIEIAEDTDFDYVY